MSFKKQFEHSEKLFDAALDEFVARGYDQASINTILANAGMSKGQFYYHFGNKEGLYLALIDVMIERKKAFLEQVMQPEDFAQDIFGIFQTQIRYGMAFASEYPGINHFSESFLNEKGTPIYQKALEIHNFEDNQFIQALVEKAYARGDFREEYPLPFIKSMIGYLFTHIPEMVELTQVTDFEDPMHYLVEFMKYGLAKTPE